MAKNRNSPCIPVVIVRSSLDSLLESRMLAPLIALPLGSVTVPCTELDEVCARIESLKTTPSTTTQRISSFAIFIRHPHRGSHAPANEVAGPRKREATTG